MGMTCQEFIALLSDYLEATVTPETLQSLEAHLAGCPPCQAYLRTFRRTRDVVAAAEQATRPPVMPAEMKARLRAFLLAQLLEGES